MSEQTTEKRPRRWLVPTIVGALSLFVGIGIGAASGDSTEPAADTEPEPTPTVTVTADPSEDLLAEIENREAALDTREEALDELRVELDDREAAITETEEQVAANTITDGVWVVGTDIEPGTYRAVDVSSDCYWGIYETGTNQSEIIDNGIPGGGNPQVTLSEGHDFESSRCGEWTRQ